MNCVLRKLLLLELVGNQLLKGHQREHHEVALVRLRLTKERVRAVQTIENAKCAEAVRELQMVEVMRLRRRKERNMITTVRIRRREDAQDHPEPRSRHV